MFGRRINRLRMHPREEGQVHATRRDIDPLPALRAQCLGGWLKLLAGEPLQQGQIGDIGVLVIAEQITAHSPAGAHVIIQADKTGHSIMAHLRVLASQRSTQVMRMAAVARHIVEGGFLCGMVIGQRQGHQLLQRGTALPVSRDQAR
ncbi:hypothetical protein FQZ97_1112060 [compost metagenome]